jgi:hypothetical protein
MLSVVELFWTTALNGNIVSIIINNNNLRASKV